MTMAAHAPSISVADARTQTRLVIGVMQTPGSRRPYINRTVPAMRSIDDELLASIPLSTSYDDQVTGASSSGTLPVGRD